jgi:hypothetical protein
VPFRYNTTDHGGFSGVQMAKVVGSKIQAFGPIQTTDPTRGSAIATYSGSQPSPPANGIPTQ